MFNCVFRIFPILFQRDCGFQVAAWELLKLEIKGSTSFFREAVQSAAHSFPRWILTYDWYLILVPLPLTVFEPEKINISVTKAWRMHELGEGKTNDRCEFAKKCRCLEAPPWPCMWNARLAPQALLSSHGLILVYVITAPSPAPSPGSFPSCTFGILHFFFLLINNFIRLE